MAKRKSTSKNHAQTVNEVNNVQTVENPKVARADYRTVIFVGDEKIPAFDVSDRLLLQTLERVNAKLTALAVYQRLWNELNKEASYRGLL